MSSKIKKSGRNTKECDTVENEVPVLFFDVKQQAGEERRDLKKQS